MNTFDPMNFPKLEFYINDFSGVLNKEEKDKYNNLLKDHQDKYGEQIAIVFFPHRNGNELRDIALKLFNENRIGNKETNNGILLIISTEEQKIRIITGKGMEIEYPYDLCKEIIENHLRVLLNNGNYDEIIKKWCTITTNKKNIIRMRYKVKKIAKNSLVITFILGIAFLFSYQTYQCVTGKINCNTDSSYSRDTNYNNSNSSSDWGGGSSSWGSSSSSSDWGGGSSNGGGYGD